MPMLVLAGLSIAILLAELIVESSARLADSWLLDVLAYTDLVIMSVFAAEFARRISMVPRELRIRYILANPIDVLVVLVIGAQPVRLFRSAKAFRALRAVRAVAIVGKGSRHSVAVAVTRARLVQGVTVVIIAVAVGAYGLAYFEGAQVDRFSDLADAFWWSAATITTLGPGIELVQTGSRIVAIALTVIGLVVVAALAGTISAFFVETSPAPSGGQGSEVAALRADRGDSQAEEPPETDQ